MACFESTYSPISRARSVRPRHAGPREADQRDVGPKNVGPWNGDWARLDPSAALRRLLALDNPPEGLAEDALLGWLIALPGGVDPADAARELADRPELSARSGEAARLRGLLRDVSHYPAAALSRGRRRR